MKAIFTGTEQDLIECGFFRDDFGLYGAGDYIPQQWYVYEFNYKHKCYRIRTNDYFSSSGEIYCLYLLKEKKDKQYKNCIYWKYCNNWKIFYKWLDKCKKKNDKPLIQDIIDKKLVRWE